MKRRRIAALPLVVLLLWAAPATAYADNCSDLSDCYGLVQAAAAALAAMALLTFLIMNPGVVVPLIALGEDVFGVIAGIGEALAGAGEAAEGVALAAEGAEAVEAALAGAEALEAGEAALAGAEAALAGAEALEAGEAAAIGAESAAAGEAAALGTEAAEVAANVDRTLAVLDQVNAVGGTTNCTELVQAVDSMLGGGLPQFGLDSAPAYAADLEAAYGSEFVNSSFSGIADALLAEGSGARGIVQVSYYGEEVGHVFNVVNNNGVILYIDAQTGLASTDGLAVALNNAIPQFLEGVKFMLTAPL